jgi:hypothetical protein
MTVQERHVPEFIRNREYSRSKSPVVIENPPTIEQIHPFNMVVEKSEHSTENINFYE